MLNVLRRMFGQTTGSQLDVRWKKRGGWLGTSLVDRVQAAPRKKDIEAAASATNSLGPQLLAPEYGEVGGTRTPGVVRSSSECGDFYAWLIQQRAPDTVVEFGSAFGVSGMYFAAGLEAAQCGHLYSFEINHEWAEIAERNIRSISARVTLTREVFEDQFAAVVPGTVDLALVDGIHTREFVMRQFDVLRPRMTRGGLIIFDDINFEKPNARMAEAWHEIVGTPDVVGAVELGGRVGVVELV
jgi:predicted O-methyltransferase YrrM